MMTGSARACAAFLATLLVAFTLALGAARAQEGDAAAEAPPPLPEAVVSADTPLDELTLRLNPLTAEELQSAADEWLGIVKERTEALVDAQVEAMSDDAAVAEAARDRIVELGDQRDQMFRKFSVVVDALEKKGGDEAAVTKYRQYRNAIVVEEVRTADLQTLLAQAQSWALSRDGGIKLAIDVAIIAAAFMGLLIVARMIKGVAWRGVRRIPNVSNLLKSFILVVIYWITITVGLMVVLSALGVDISPVFALFGGAAFILAFALQDTLGNLAAGLMIMINRPFDEGDYVNVAGVGGTVKSVSVVSTTVLTPDNQVIVIPNGKVWGDIITNVTTSPTRRVDLTFGIGYDDSIADAQRILEEAVAAHPLVLKEPAPTIRVNELADSSVNFVCRPWTKSEDYWTVYWDLMRDVKERFDRGGVSIPFPQQDVHFHGFPGAAEEPAAAPAARETARAYASRPGQGSEARNDPAEGDDERGG
jgi:small conductance mechanosensitive channel